MQHAYSVEPGQAKASTKPGAIHVEAGLRSTGRCEGMWPGQLARRPRRLATVWLRVRWRILSGTATERARDPRASGADQAAVPLGRPASDRLVVEISQPVTAGTPTKATLRGRHPPRAATRGRTSPRVPRSVGRPLGKPSTRHRYRGPFVEVGTARYGTASVIGRRRSTSPGHCSTSAGSGSAIPSPGAVSRSSTAARRGWAERFRPGEQKPWRVAALA